MAGKLFGTDGVRGLAGEFLTAELATALGRAAAAIAPAEAPQVLIVRDTRESGEMLEAALAAGAPQAAVTRCSAACCRPRARRCWSAVTASTWRPWSRRRTTPTR